MSGVTGQCVTPRIVRSHSLISCSLQSIPELCKGLQISVADQVFILNTFLPEYGPHDVTATFKCFINDHFFFKELLLLSTYIVPVVKCVDTISYLVFQYVLLLR